MAKKIDKENDIIAAEETKVEEETVEKKEVKKEELVQVKKEDLDALIKQVEKQAKDLELLYKATDKSRLAKAIGNGGEPLIHTAKVSKWGDTQNFVLGWKLLTNRAEVINGRYIEDQTVEVQVEGMDPFIVPILEFYRNILHKEDGEIVSNSKKFNKETMKDEEFVTLEFKNGRKFEINISFIN